MALWTKAGRGIWGLGHVFEGKLYFTKDIVDVSFVPKNKKPKPILETCSQGCSKACPKGQACPPPLKSPACNPLPPADGGNHHLATDAPFMPMQFSYHCTPPANAPLLPMHTSCQCTPPANAHLLPMHPSCQCTPPANAHLLPMHTSCQCTPPANAHLLPMHTSCQCAPSANAPLLPMHPSCQCTPPANAPLLPMRFSCQRPHASAPLMPMPSSQIHPVPVMPVEHVQKFKVVWFHDAKIPHCTTMRRVQARRCLSTGNTSDRSFPDLQRPCAREGA